MKQLVKIGRVFYSMGLVAFGIQQVVSESFRPEILPPFPAWANDHVAFPVITGMALVSVGAIVSGLFRFKDINARRTCLYLACCFLFLFLVCHLPYILFFSPNKASHLGVWDGAFEELAYAGGALVMAGSFPASSSGTKTSFDTFGERLIPFGRIFYAALIILYGVSHFVYFGYVSAMVPKWCGMPAFWTYFCGAALIGAGVAIVSKTWMRPAALLLALMLFLWCLFIHIPDAINDPRSGYANQVVRALVALLFSGIALVIAATNTGKKKIERN